MMTGDWAVLRRREILRKQKRRPSIFFVPLFSGILLSIDGEIRASKTEVKAFITHTLVAGL